MRLLVVSCAPLVSSFTLSLACLLLTHIKHDCEGPVPNLQRPTYCLPPVPHTVTHLNCSSFFCVTSPFPPVIDILMCFSCWVPSCLSRCVVSELCWNLTSRPSGDDTPDESLNQYLPVFLSSLSFQKFFSLIVFPPSP